MSGARERYRRAAELFSGALERPPNERAAFLDEACGDDAALRGDVQRLLDADVGAESGAMDEAGIAMPWLHDAAAARRIGAYRIVRTIGQGGMGTVYLAEQETPRRQVALKVIRRGLTSTQALRRFRHESEILGQLRHPGIAHVYGAGMHDDGEGSRPYFAMEYIDGESLTAHARRRDLSDRERLELFARVCDAVHHAHQKGVIHRDIKPDNILVTAAGDPKILDFGVARVTDGDLKATTIQTKAGQLVGTLAYMSPEQLDGIAVELDTRSDVYALGVVLFELLADRLPYALPDATVTEMIRAIQDDEPTHLSTIDARHRGDVDTIVAKAIEKDRERRYGSAAELAADIRRHMDDEPIAAHRPSRLYRLRKFTRRNRSLVIGLTATMLAIVIGGIASFVFALHNLHLQRLADASAREADWSSYRFCLDAAAAKHDGGDDGGARAALESAPARLRSWEWAYLRGQLDRVVPALSVMRPAAISAVAFRPDGTAVAAIALPDHIAVYDLETERPIARIDAVERDDGSGPGAPPPPRIIAMSPDGSILVTAPGHDIADLWNTRDGRHMARVRNRGNPRAISPDGSTLATWDDANGGRLVDVATTAAIDVCARPNPGQGRSSSHAAFSHDGRRVAWATYADGARRYLVADATTGATLAERREPSPRHAGIPAWSPTDDRIALRLVNEPTRILDAATLEPIGAIPMEAPAPGGIAFLDDATLIRSEPGRNLSRIDLADGTVHHLLALDHQRDVTDVVASDDGRRFIVHGRGWARLHDLEAPRPFRVLAGHAAAVYTHAWSPDGALLATGAWDGTVRVWDGATGASLGALGGGSSGRPDVPKGLQFDAGARRLEICVHRRTGEGLFVVRAWSPTTGALTETLVDDVDTYLRAAPPGLRLEWGVSSVMSPAPRPGEFNVVSDDGRLLAAPAPDGVAVVERATGATICRLTGLEPQIVGISKDGTRLVTGDALGVVRLWDLCDGRRLAERTIHAGEVFCATFSPDDTRLVTGGRDGMRVCSAATLDVLLRPDVGDSFVRSASFSPDGTRIAAASGDGLVRLHDAVPWRTRRAEAEESATRRAAMRPLVDDLLAELGDGDAVADRIAENPALTALERSAAMFVLATRALRGTRAPE